MGSNKNKKRRRTAERPTTHPRNKYSNNPPDFAELASLYPTFKPFVFFGRDGRPRIDWTDFNATRELTRVLLLHDHCLNWWIPDGQLCPTVPNRSNYIHWIEDLLSSDIIAKTTKIGDKVRGFDIGTGANCIYPLLGASLLGWSFVGSDMTDVALEWAEKNVRDNPHISELIEIRKVESGENTLPAEGSNNEALVSTKTEIYLTEDMGREGNSLNTGYYGPPILLGVVRDGEEFDFCMCNPPFFETMEEAGLNPKTSCGGTPAEMICPGGEKAFVTCIIEDSVTLRHTFRWYTSMLGRKSNLKLLTSKLWEVGATVVKTTEFVQGQTCRWGLAWSFLPSVKKILSSHVTEKSNLSFMLQGLERKLGAIHVLQSVEDYFRNAGALCKLNTSSFTVDITAKDDKSDANLKSESQNYDGVASCDDVQEASGSSCLNLLSNNLSFRVSVFQQTPGTLLVKGSLQQRDGQISGSFSPIFRRLEEVLKQKFHREK
ncbi:putative 23S rRNA (adenine(1618)-N(6))-methyltransferase [Rosa chinensis]|uniref:U6 small nuclear RNA (adenine-(43)-N(6))-methyltransferase n=1 Tax=Rosa chinensis TaxID=74649 RepID=A0A2P6PJ12_ROSCH|nr:RNA N6-adenosine-methyltransferase mettl16 isoform X4 [Rosa chinensis]XP_024165167.1 RNA N6-adenosine-methyltransferase mettl16 isoform X4 [Rosa chinensis]XP_024165168.1 RNA N6-adenosine-methyltransferase mettl16 isoform X4 [Rosa chinensis]XP_024165169.1 RNA N6-adenosine-methyltransferase mettl16 isoform X4 [Rosa chinensis]XP_024165172.1 RNA N6-adenosine-methyltransferase mettl16 isoform X4 [Rosa chinensis]XP_024165173.1 RNA N6-adenosine-methyltransferase mettl16 isoform X4 [Rosa chinensis]